MTCRADNLLYAYKLICSGGSFANHSSGLQGNGLADPAVIGGILANATIDRIVSSAANDYVIGTADLDDTSLQFTKVRTIVPLSSTTKIEFRIVFVASIIGFPWILVDIGSRFSIRPFECSFSCLICKTNP